MASDHWGTRPLYYAFNDDTLIYGEDIDALNQQLPRVSLNKDALARFLLEDFSHPEETILQEIKKLPAGHFLIFKNGKTQILPWHRRDSWNPVHHDFQNTLELWKSKLEENLERLLPRHKKWGLFLSGGLDSSGLLALTMEIVQKKQWPISIEIYHMTSLDPETDDAGFTKSLADHYKIPLRTYQATPEKLQALYKDWNLKNTLTPYFPTLQMFEPLIKMAADNECGGLLFGYGADEQWTLPDHTLGLDLLTENNIAAFLKASKNTSNFYRKALKLWAQYQSPEILKHLFKFLSGNEFPNHLAPNPRLKKLRSELKARMQEAQKPLVSYSQKQLFLRNFVSGNNPHNFSAHAALAQTYGLEVHFPYLSPQLFDISLLSSTGLLSQAKDKKILRECLKGHLLENIRQAPKFQDYSHLAYKTALQLAQLDTNLICLEHWIKSDIELVHFDNDSYFEILYANKLLKTYGAGIEKNEKTLSEAKT